jgi:hypothetical protein
MHSGWDQHGNLYTQLEAQCRDTDSLRLRSLRI